MAVKLKIGMVFERRKKSDLYPNTIKIEKLSKTNPKLVLGIYLETGRPYVEEDFDQRRWKYVKPSKLEKSLK